MEILEIKQKETLRREEVAKRLRDFADMLERQNDLEIETDERELEIELTW